MGDLQDAHLLVAGEVVDAVGRPGAQRRHHPRGDVLDVNEAPRLRALARDGQLLAPLGATDQGGDHRGVPSPGPIRNPEPEDRVLDSEEPPVGLAVELAGELGRRVQVARRGHGRLLVDAALRAVAVDPGRAAVDHSLEPGFAGGLEDLERPLGVAALGAIGRGDDVADVRHRGQVDGDVDPAGGPLQRLAVGHVAEDLLDLAWRVMGRGTEVEDERLVSSLQELVDHV